MGIRSIVKEPAEHVGFFYRLRDHDWYSLKRKSIVYVESYLPRKREFIVWSYQDNKRYAVPLRDFVAKFFTCIPQPKMERPQ